MPVTVRLPVWARNPTSRPVNVAKVGAVKQGRSHTSRLASDGGSGGMSMGMDRWSARSERSPILASRSGPPSRWTGRSWDAPGMDHEELTARVRALRATGRSPKQIARVLSVPPATVAPLIRTIAAEQHADAPELPLAGCWVSPGWSERLTITGHHRWPDLDTADPGTSPLPAPLDLAQHLVFGAVDYARGLGFEPAPGFEATTGHLGTWTGPSAIQFGHDGKPLYIQGPHDDAERILTTLGRSTGQDFDDRVVGP